MKPKTFYSNGKLLITGEYLVLDGAMALAIPTTYGQSLSIEPQEYNITWESYDDANSLWFEAQFSLNPLKCINSSDSQISERLLQILNTTQLLNPNFLKDHNGLKVKTNLNFPRNWGLGTSSTLINNISQWAQIDPYLLLEQTFGGSGYDIACAQHNRPITYQLETKGRAVIETDFNPEFKQHLYFVFLNKKKNSRDAIATYSQTKRSSVLPLAEINAITKDMISCSSLENFQFLMENHERLIAKSIHQKPIKDVLFKDFKGSIKSLGAWGGDFVLVAADTPPKDYFKSKGFETIIAYQDMVL